MKANIYIHLVRILHNYTNTYCLLLHDDVSNTQNVIPSNIMRCDAIKYFKT